MKLNSFKWLIVFTVLAIFLFVIFLVSFSFFETNDSLRFSSLSIVAYFFIASVVVMTSMEFLIRNYDGNSSYVFLLTVFLKIGFFILIFQQTVFNIDAFSGVEKAVLVLPMILFLVIEAVFLMKRMDT